MKWRLNNNLQPKSKSVQNYRRRCESERESAGPKTGQKLYIKINNQLMYPHTRSETQRSPEARGREGRCLKYIKLKI